MHPITRLYSGKSSQENYFLSVGNSEYQAEQFYNSKEQAVLDSSVPITQPYYDKEGRTIQFWKHKNDFIGSIQEIDGTITLVGADKICNSMSSKGSSKDFLQRIEELSLRKWALLYKPERKTIFVWPHLVAAGTDDKPWQPPIFSKNP